MLVSFYIQISIIAISFLLVLLPFLGLPQSFDRVLTAIFSALIFGISVYALYQGYVRVLRREEKRLEQHTVKEKKVTFQPKESPKEEHHVDSKDEDSEIKNDGYGSLHIVRD